MLPLGRQAAGKTGPLVGLRLCSPIIRKGVPFKQMADKIPMTKKGYEKLQSELEHLRKVERSKNIREIEEARGHGDLSENAEYHAAKERQGFIECRMQELQGKLALAQVIDTSRLSNEKVVFGATVVLLDQDSE